ILTGSAAEMRSANWESGRSIRARSEETVQLCGALAARARSADAASPAIIMPAATSGNQRRDNPTMVPQVVVLKILITNTKVAFLVPLGGQRLIALEGYGQHEPYGSSCKLPRKPLTRKRFEIIQDND